MKKELIIFAILLIILGYSIYKINSLEKQIGTMKVYEKNTSDAVVFVANYIDKVSNGGFTRYIQEKNEKAN